MYKVFNMGHRLEIYTAPENADRVIEIAAGFNLEARVIGRCEESVKKRLSIKSEFGVFEY